MSAGPSIADLYLRTLARGVCLGKYVLIICQLLSCQADRVGRDSARDSEYEAHSNLYSDVANSKLSRNEPLLPSDKMLVASLLT